VVSPTRGLKGKCSAGYDDITYLVKKFIQLVKKPLTHICNVSLNSGVFPNEWKIASLNPLIKRYDIQNYKLISVLSVFSKILEMLIFNRLIHFLSNNRIFTEAQNGFRKGNCNETAIQSFIYKRLWTKD